MTEQQPDPRGEPTDRRVRTGRADRADRADRVDRADRADRPPGYRGALPPRNDALARPWVLAVIGLFVLIVILSLAGVPSRFLAEPSPLPIPSVQPSSSFSLLPSGSAEVSPAP
jgi:hypothetical protein